MSEKLFDISVVLPVFSGGELFMDAIYSIENSKIPFKNVFISFNGNSDFDYQKFINIKLGGKFINNYVLFQTNKDLDAIEHTSFMVDLLKDYLDDDSTVFLLAHDDRIVPPNLIDFISLLNQYDLKTTIFFPSYRCCNSDNYNNVLKIIVRNEYISSENFFFKSLKENISTNISGMILPFNAFYTSAEAIRISNSRGARSEHTICISPKIKNVCFHNQLYMLIGERPHSEGKLLSYRDHRVAAFYYIWLFLKNGQLKTLSKVPVYLYFLAKNWFGYLLYR